MRLIISRFVTILLALLALNQGFSIDFKDSVQVEKWSNEARAIFSKDFDKAIKMCDEAFELAKPDSVLMLKPLTSKALIYFQSGKKEESLEVMDKVIELAKTSNNLVGLSSAYRNLGQIEYYTGSYEKALSAYIKANEVYKQYGEYDANPNLLMNIADLHLTLQDVKKAKTTYFEALNLADAWGDELVADVKTRLAKIYLKENKLDSAQLLAEDAQKLYDKAGKNVVFNSPKSVLAEVYEKQNKIDKAIPILEERKALFLEKNDERSYAGVAIRLGVLYAKQNNLDKALSYFKDSYQINKKLKSPAIIDDLNFLSYYYEKKGDYNQALTYHKEYLEKYKEVLDEKKLEQINDMQVKYETEKKERENEKLAYQLSLSEKDAEIAMASSQRKNYLIIGAAILLFLFIVVGVLFWNRRRIVYSYKMLKLEQNLLKTQMNPHFISNALMSAQGYIYDNKMEEASDYLTKIAKLTRQVLENSRKESVTLEEEIDSLKNYMIVQQKRYNNFDFELNVSDDLDIEEIEVAPMLTQPLVENAIEHGINGIDYRGKVQIDYSINKEKKLQILVTDNGKGFKESKQVDGHNSISSQIIKERLLNLAAFYKQKLDFQITDNNQEGHLGTKVLLTLPVNLH